MENRLIITAIQEQEVIVEVNGKRKIISLRISLSDGSDIVVANDTKWLGNIKVGMPITIKVDLK